ncbi:MAG: hemin uptake protein HemP [Sulfitobacter sp.]
MTQSTSTPPPVIPPVQSAPLPAYDAREIMRDGAQAQLLLDGKTYILRITRAGKLILTK